jgi:hypothetical protein
MAWFGGATVSGDPELRWTVIAEKRPAPLGPPFGNGVLRVVPVPDMARDIGSLLAAVRGRVSAVGVAGTVTAAIQTALRGEGVSRICQVGDMQSPPLDWPNGNRDLLRDLCEIA